MNINFDLKNILAFFKKTSFKLAFFIGIIIYRFLLLEQDSKISVSITNILLVVAIIFLTDDIITKIINIINKKITLKKAKKEIRELSDPQVRILVLNFLIFDKNEILINPTSYFNIQDGLYQILLNKLIIFQATNMQNSFNFPFTLQEWAYKELDDSIKKEKISFKKNKNDYILNWYGRSINIPIDVCHNKEENYYV